MDAPKRAAQIEWNPPCGECGVVFRRRHFNDKYCDECKEVVSRRRQRDGSRAWAKRNPDKKLALHRSWAARNPEAVILAAARRRARIRGATVEPVPSDIKERLVRHQSGRCAAPRCRLRVVQDGHLDHIFPISRGGSHATSNLQVLCGPCNRTKSAKDPRQWLQDQGELGLVPRGAETVRGAGGNPGPTRCPVAPAGRYEAAPRPLEVQDARR